MMDYIFFFFPTFSYSSLERAGTLKKEFGKIRPFHESLKMHFQNVITDHQQL